METEHIITDSRILKWVKYEKEGGYLSVLFASGKRRKYKRVPKSVYDELMVAESKGRYIHANVVGKYRYNKIRAIKKYFIFDSLYKKIKTDAVCHEMWDYVEKAIKESRKFKTSTVVVEGILEDGVITHPRIIDKNLIKILNKNQPKWKRLKSK